ncbi:hypothetical protein ABEF95_010711 [Exophiala dermatitidis]
MAKGLDDLIQYLLEEIALSGNEGVTINDIAAFTTAFYQEPNSNSTADAAANFPLSQSVAVDERFLSKIWTWLGRHPDVSIGDDGEYNEIPLSEIERKFPGYLHINGEPAQPEGVDQDKDASQQTPAADGPLHTIRSSTVSDGPRIRVNDERRSLAICGHPLDTSKVSSLEFDLLSHIAAARSNGIIQGDLRQATGQDKRSVPKRTDTLQKKGYIIKTTVYRKGIKTSRLFLKKFAPTVSHDATKTSHGSSVRDVVRRIFDVLSKEKLVPQSKLAEVLSLKTSAESAILVGILRQLERLKCVKRIRSAVGPSATVSDLQHFVQLLRPAGYDELENFDTENLMLDHSLDDLSSLAELNDDIDPVIDVAATDDRAEGNGISRHVARWNPDRLISNVVVDAARQRGKAGMTNLDARLLITGVFVRRTLESLLHRISARSLVVQPPHLRHLAVVRISIIVDGVTQYVHYSWDAFRQLAERHEVDITLIPGAKEALQTTCDNTPDPTTTVPPVQSSSKVDQFGFPLRGSIPLQHRNGEASPEDLIRTVGAGDLLPRTGELTVVEKNGVSILQPIAELMQLQVADPGSSTGSPRQRQAGGPRGRKGRARQQSETETTLGRPRKYPKGTEKFWRLQFQQARLEAGGKSAVSKRGVMQDRAGLALYANRPAEFDETLVAAIEAGLPVPATPQDINDAWVASTKNVLGRQSDGVYISPGGMRPEYAKRKSMIMIIKTPRLREVDVHDRSKLQPFRLISSMVAHSFPYIRYDPDVDVKLAPTRKSARKARGQRLAPELEEEKGPGPSAGVFVEDRLPQSSNTRLDQTPQKPGVLIDGPLEMTDEERRVAHESALDTRSVGKASRGSAASKASERNSPAPPQEEHGPSSESSSIVAEQKSASVKPLLLASAETPVSGIDLGQDIALRNPSEMGQDQHDQNQREFRNKSGTPAPVSSMQNQEVHRATLPPEAVEMQPVASPQLVDNILASEPAPVEAEVGGFNNALPADQAIPSVEASVLEQGTPVTGDIARDIPGYATAHTIGQSDLISKFANEFPAAEDRNGAELPAPSVAEDNVALASIGVPQKPGKKRMSRAKSRPGPQVPSTQEAETVQPPGKGRVRDAKDLCKKIILELIFQTSGVVPNDASTLKRVSVPRWQEAGEKGIPLLKTIKAAVKSLCERGTIKQVTFTFRGKSGIMVKRTVLFLPHISPHSDLVEEGKQKIIEAEPADYVPPEWEAEAARIPLVEKKTQHTAYKPDSTPPTGRERPSSPGSDTTIDTQAARDTRSVTRGSTRQPSPSPPPRVSAATGFLTLKVPSLGKLAVVQLHDQKMTAPVSTLSLNNATPVADQSIPVRGTASRRGRGGGRGRGGRKPTARSGGRSVLWVGDHRRDFPSCLDDILGLSHLKINSRDVDSAHPEWRRFAWGVEAVRAWEVQEESSQAERTRCAFINHLVPPALYSSSIYPTTIEFATLTSTDEHGCEIELAYPPTESWPVFVSALHKSPEVASQITGKEPRERTTPAPPPAKTGKTRRYTRPSKRKLLGDNDDAEDGTFTPQAKRPRGAAKGSGAKRGSRQIAQGKQSDTPTKLSRGPQYLRALPEEVIHRIRISVIVVRTLAGGVECYVDWSLVMTLFPGQEEDFIKRCWRTLSTRERSDIRALTESLQWKYLSALEVGEVPSINFQDLKATDWHGIVGWAMRNLDKFNIKQTADDLPNSRDRLLDSHKLEFSQRKRSWHILSTPSWVSNPFKESIVSSVVFGADAQATTCTPSLEVASSRYELESPDPELRVARSWVYSTVLTPEEKFSPLQAHAKLSTLAPTPAENEALLTRGLKVLQDAKLLQRANRGMHQGMTMRCWDGRRKLWERFEERRMMNRTILRRAVTYKLHVMDQAFATGGSVILEKEAIVDDGEMVAILNLMAGGQIRTRAGADVPNTRYGLDHERIGYRTKNMDKGLLYFSVEFVSTPAYVYGVPNGVNTSKIPIPRGEADQPRGHIPPWIDIHGNIQDELWEMFLVGVIGLVMQMPGITAAELSRALGYALDRGEIELILNWCVQGGFAKMETNSKGYETTEDWWWCLSASPTSRDENNE